MLVSINKRDLFRDINRMLLMGGILFSRSVWAEQTSRPIGSRDVSHSSLINKVIRAESEDQLRRVLEIHQEEAVKKASCLFQNENALPPTFCFTAEMSPEDREHTTTVCVARARRAKLIPAHDDWTDERCLRALQERRKDLRYADR